MSEGVSGPVFQTRSKRKIHLKRKCSEYYFALLSHTTSTSRSPGYGSAKGLNSGRFRAHAISRSFSVDSTPSPVC